MDTHDITVARRVVEQLEKGAGFFRAFMITMPTLALAVFGVLLIWAAGDNQAVANVGSGIVSGAVLGFIIISVESQLREGRYMRSAARVLQGKYGLPTIEDQIIEAAWAEAEKRLASHPETAEH